MTTYLTRIALCAVALFFICLIAGAAILRTSNLRTSNSGDSEQKQATPAAAQAEAGSDTKTIAVHRSNLALQQSQQVENIPYYFGKIRDEAPTHNFRRSGANLSEGSSVIYLER